MAPAEPPVYSTTELILPRAPEEPPVEVHIDRGAHDILF